MKHVASIFHYWQRKTENLIGKLSESQNLYQFPVWYISCDEIFDLKNELAVYGMPYVKTLKFPRTDELLGSRLFSLKSPNVSKHKHHICVAKVICTMQTQIHEKIINFCGIVISTEIEDIFIISLSLFLLRVRP